MDPGAHNVLPPWEFCRRAFDRRPLSSTGEADPATTDKREATPPRALPPAPQPTPANPQTLPKHNLTWRQITPSFPYAFG